MHPSPELLSDARHGHRHRTNVIVVRHSAFVTGAEQQQESRGLIDRHENYAATQRKTSVRAIRESKRHATLFAIRQSAARRDSLVLAHLINMI